MYESVLMDPAESRRLPTQDQIRSSNLGNRLWRTPQKITNLCTRCHPYFLVLQFVLFAPLKTHYPPFFLLDGKACSLISKISKGSTGFLVSGFGFAGLPARSVAAAPRTMLP